MPRYQHAILKKFSGNSNILTQLYEIFKATLKPDMTYREFRFYYFRHKPHLLDISFLKDGDTTIGFICVSFYRHRFGAAQYTICRGAIGILKQYRGGALPNWLLCWKYMKYKFTHPSEQVYLSGFMANPLIYSMICKYTGKVYPKKGVVVTNKIETLRKHIIKHYGLNEEGSHPFVMKIHFQVQLEVKDEKRIYESDNKHVRFYLGINPAFKEQFGVLTLVPVNWFNISVSIVRAFLQEPGKKYYRRIIRLAQEKISQWKKGILLRWKRPSANAR